MNSTFQLFAVSPFNRHLGPTRLFLPFSHTHCVSVHAEVISSPRFKAKKFMLSSPEIS